MHNCLFSGDGPCRAFEAGQQINGHYPCSCGQNAGNFPTVYQMLQRPPYCSIADRIAVINKSDSWTNRSTGTVAIYDNLDVSIKYILHVSQVRFYY